MISLFAEFSDMLDNALSRGPAVEPLGVKDFLRPFKYLSVSSLSLSFSSVSAVALVATVAAVGLVLY